MSLYVLKTNRMKFLCELMVICASLLSCPFVFHTLAESGTTVTTGECLFAGSGGFFVGARFTFWISGCKFKCTEEYISRADDGGSDSSAIRVKREVFEHGTVGF